MSADLIELWHRRARPEPTKADFDVQLGCHFEEIAELLAELELVTPTLGITKGVDSAAWHAIKGLAESRKTGQVTATITNRAGVLDALCDQVVTATGVAHCANMHFDDALREVNRSNFSKFDYNGQPTRDANGKITKGDRYSPPDLTGYY